MSTLEESPRARGRGWPSGFKKHAAAPIKAEGVRERFQTGGGRPLGGSSHSRAHGWGFYERVGLALTSSGSAIGRPHLLSFPPCYRGVTVVFCGRFGDTPSGCPNSFRGVDRPRKESTGHDVEGRSSDQPHAPQLITACAPALAEGPRSAIAATLIARRSLRPTRSAHRAGPSR